MKLIFKLFILLQIEMQLQGELDYYGLKQQLRLPNHKELKNNDIKAFIDIQVTLFNA